MTLVHSGASAVIPSETEAADVTTVVRLCGEIARLQAENAALRRDLAKALKPRNLKPLRESYARLLHRPSVGTKASAEVNQTNQVNL